MEREFEAAFMDACRLVAHMAQLGGLNVESSEGTFRPAAMQRRAACEYLDIGTTKFSELIKSGDLPKPFRLGGRDRWLREDLDQVVRKLARGARLADGN